jgi:hypothetical protein
MSLNFISFRAMGMTEAVEHPSTTTATKKKKSLICKFSFRLIKSHISTPLQKMSTVPIPSLLQQPFVVHASEG